MEVAQNFDSDIPTELQQDISTYGKTCMHRVNYAPRVAGRIGVSFLSFFALSPDHLCSSAFSNGTNDCDRLSVALTMSADGGAPAAGFCGCSLSPH